MVKRNNVFGFSKASLGTHAARSMMLTEMSLLIRGMPFRFDRNELVKAVLEKNILEKPTLSSRRKSLRHLSGLYGSDPASALFRVLWDFACDDFDALPQICLVCAYARDPQLRHSFELIRRMSLGEVLVRSDMEIHIENGFPGRFSPATKRSMAQNVNTTWTHGGHLSGKIKKVRRFPAPRPISAAYAMFVGYLTGLRGESLLNSPFAGLVAPDRAHLLSALGLSSARGLLSLKQAADIVEFDFSPLLTPEEQEDLHEPH